MRRLRKTTDFARVWLTLVLLGGSAALVRAQDASAPAPSAEGTRPAQPNKAARVADRILRVFRAPIHPTLDTVAAGGGLTVGIGYSPPPWMAGHLFVTASASISVRNYWGTDAKVAWQHANRFRLEGYGRARRTPQLTFYGLGSDSLRASETDFRLLERAVGWTGWIRPAELGEIVTIGGRLEHLWPEVGPGTKSRLPSIEQRFIDASAPGLADQPAFIHAQAFVTMAYPAPHVVNRPGGEYQVAYGVFSDRTAGGANSFHRLDVELRQRILVLGPDRVVTLHALTSLSSATAGSRVPFYLMQTLGGGSSLRGFSDYRLRDRDFLLLQADYRFKVWSLVHASVFADAGKVTGRNADYNLRDLRHDVGVGVSIVRRGLTLVRFDVGLGGGEGIHTFFSVGPLLAF